MFIHSFIHLYLLKNLKFHYNNTEQKNRAGRKGR